MEYVNYAAYLCHSKCTLNVSDYPHSPYSVPRRSAPPDCQKQQPQHPLREGREQYLAELC